MLFNSFQYAVFLPAVWLAFRFAPNRWRIDVLVVASYLFYASWSVPYAFILFGLAVANYLFGKGIAVVQHGRYRRLLLVACTIVDLGVLGVFKYWDFLVRSVATAIGVTTKVRVSPPLLHLALPLGISFFTFELIHYVVDVYRGSLPIHGFRKFHAFVAFFPTLIAGPIKRFQNFVPSLSSLDHFDGQQISDGLALIALGLAKKVLLADNLAPVANKAFAPGTPGTLGFVDAWTAVLAFSLQIYFDFSGYTDIARGSAQLFGIWIPVNFNAPYLASSPADFWHRWHISLSTWLRDYVYIPLGGSRGSLAATVGNLLITFLLGGLWHGAAWHFVVWGAFWGLMLAAERLARSCSPKLAESMLSGLSGWALTGFLVLVGWVFFRAATVGDAAGMLRQMTPGHNGHATSGMETDSLVIAVAAILVTLQWCVRQEPWPDLTSRIGSYWSSLRAPLRALLVGFLAACGLIATVVIAPEAHKFIYFQF